MNLERPADVAAGAERVTADRICPLDRLMPMHVRLDADGRILHAGPSLRRLAGDRDIDGLAFLDLFHVRRPSGVEDPAGLFATEGKPLHVTLQGTRPVHLNGCLARSGDNGSAAMINLSLGLSELTDLGGTGLTCTDFAPTDKTVDMLYLIEAKSAAMAESRRLIGRLQGAKSAAEAQALTDTLTGLANRRALDLALDRLAGGGQSFALTNVDLDFFKAVNDTMGHAAGDHVLTRVAEILLDVTRSSDIVARVGGDEFVVLFAGLTDRDQLERIGRRMIARIEEPVEFEGEECRISASLGTALSTDYARIDTTRMKADADTALYASKAAGRAQHTIFDVDAPVPGDRRS